jgi:peroxiredoxin
VSNGVWGGFAFLDFIDHDGQRGFPLLRIGPSPDSTIAHNENEGTMATKIRTSVSRWLGFVGVLVGLSCEGTFVFSQSDAGPADGGQNATAPTHAGDSDEQHPASGSPLAGHSFHAEVFNEGPRQAARLIPGTGIVDFPVTTDHELAQQFFNQGVGQLHGFWYFEAERSFRQAAALDNRCAMFYWGMAMANLKNPERASKFIEQAKTRVDSASEREKQWIGAVAKFCTTKDTEGKDVPLEKRAQQYTRDLEEIIFLQPQDIEVKAFLAGHLWENQRRELAIVSHVAVNALLQQIFDVSPLHPAHHYRIHLWDQRDAKQALPSAASCGPAGPNIAHMWHMPGHIYSGLHRYSDAVWQMEASARVDHQHMRNDHVLPDQIHNYAHNNEWLTRNLAKIGRAHDALALADNMLSLPRHPKYNNDNSGSGHYGRQRTLQVLTSYRMWSDVVDRSAKIFLDPAGDKSRAREQHRQLGLATALAKQTDRAQESRLFLQQARETAVAERAAKAAAAEAASSATDANASADATDTNDQVAKEVAQEIGPPTTAGTIVDADKSTPPAPASAPAEQKPAKVDFTEIDREITELDQALAWIDAAEAAAAEQWCRASELAEQATGIDGLLKAEWHAAAGKAKLAWDAVSNEVGNRPNDTVPLAIKVYVGYLLLNRVPTSEAEPTVRASETTPASIDSETNESASGDTPGEANPPDPDPVITREILLADFEQLRTVATQADLNTPLLARLEPVAQFLELPLDWRLPQPEPQDIGLRPDLDSLGPVHWAPPMAPPITVLDAQGLEIKVLASPGKAKLVMFYLGFGCLHCMEQLQKFSPESHGFAQDNIELVAISCEALELLQQGLTNFEQSLEIPLHADSQLAAFKAFRCFDDFENQPLHGTFLISPGGSILWQDIGHEPFMDVAFLKNEAPRLLKVWANE